jgi:hypothetical protein
LRQVAQELRSASRCRHIDRNADHIAVQLRDGLVNPLRSAPIDRDPRTAAGQPLGEARSPGLVYSRFAE